MEKVKTNKIKGFRNYLGLNQTQMADMLGISLAAYRNKEQGKTTWKDSERIIIKEMLTPYFEGVTIDQIFFDSKVLICIESNIF